MVYVYEKAQCYCHCCGYYLASNTFCKYLILWKVARARRPSGLVLVETPLYLRVLT